MAAVSHGKMDGDRGGNLDGAIHLGGHQWQLTTSSAGLPLRLRHTARILGEVEVEVEVEVKAEIEGIAGAGTGQPEQRIYVEVCCWTGLLPC